MSQEPEKRTASEERESYLEGYRRDLAAWENRLADLGDAGMVDTDLAVQNAKRGIANAKRGIREYGGDLPDDVETRPAGRAKSTR